MVKGEWQGIIKIMEAEIEIVFLLRFISPSGKRWGYISIFLVWCVNKMNMKCVK